MSEDWTKVSGDLERLLKNGEQLLRDFGQPGNEVTQLANLLLRLLFVRGVDLVLDLGARVSERLEMSDEAHVLIAEAHLLPGCDASIVRINADGVTVKTDTGEHRVPPRVAESLYVLAR